MTGRVVILLVIFTLAAAFAFADILPAAPFIALAVMGWGVWFAMICADRKAR